jgi:hypothetical protein
MSILWNEAVQFRWPPSCRKPTSAAAVERPGIAGDGAGAGWGTSGIGAPGPSEVVQGFWRAHAAVVSAGGEQAQRFVHC